MDSAPRGPIRVLIADGDPLVCRALVRLLQDAGDLEVVATASTAETVLALATQLQPAVVVVDAQTARLDGLAVTRRLGQQVPATRVVVVSVYATLCDAALAAGACQCLLKDGSRAELVAAIRLAAQGHCQAAGAAGLGLAG
ncbi:MAG TPA: response regulator transcription factor [Chloroflexia bacterium]|nr:response regulator transcription factor [Chloroflexia bacterium]